MIFQILHIRIRSAEQAHIEHAGLLQNENWIPFMRKRDTKELSKAVSRAIEANRSLRASEMSEQTKLLSLG